MKDIGDALTRVKAKGPNIVRSSEIERRDRELLVKTGWLQEIIKGWYMLVRPDVAPGDSAAWYAHFWNFLCLYLENRFGQDYCLSAESSLDLHVDTPMIPRQVIVIVGQGGGAPVGLPFDTSVLVYSDPKNLPEERVVKRGLQAMSLPYALCKVTPSYFQKNPDDAEIALRLAPPLELSQLIAAHGFRRAAARLLGAYRHIGDEKAYNTLKQNIDLLGIQIAAEDPFEEAPSTQPIIRTSSPYAARIHTIWHRQRDIIIKHFPTPPDQKLSPGTYLEQVEDAYGNDAYNSLSIEGYQVSPELVLRIRNHEWNPEANPDDEIERNALAVRGYYEAFQQVKITLQKVLEGQNAGDATDQDLQKWYQALYSPSVAAGILKPEELIGYRRHQVYIRNARHVPPPPNAVLDSMEALFNCLKEEPHPAVRAVLGHYLFVFIHPYMDGNGRLGRFLMNVALASGGYPWTVIPVTQRKEYLSVLTQADESNLIPLTEFVAEAMGQ